MAHEHHHHDHTVTSLNKAFILGIALNVAFVVVEFAVGLYYGSMGLLSDAGHNLSDVASLLLAMLAFRLAQAHATPRYTYGYKKSTVLISLLNSVILLVAVGVIVAESVGRMLHPAPVEGGAIAWTAGGIGLVADARQPASVTRRRSRGYPHRRGGKDDGGRAGCQGRAPHPCLGDQHYRKCPYGACRVGRAAPYGNGQKTAQSGAGNGRDPSCNARIRIFGRTLPRDVRLIARPAGRDCVPAFCGFLRFFPPCGGTYAV